MPEHVHNWAMFNIEWARRRRVMRPAADAHGSAIDRGAKDLTAYPYPASTRVLEYSGIPGDWTITIDITAIIMTILLVPATKGILCVCSPFLAFSPLAFYDSISENVID